MFPDDIRQQTQPTPPPPPPPPPEQGKVTHTVQPGEDIPQIAARYDVPPQALASANPQICNPDLLRPGDELAIPVKAGDSLPAEYEVGSGENIDTIAAKHNIPPAELIAANGITDADRLYPGDKLWIPGAGNEVLAAGTQDPIGQPAPPEALRTDDAIKQVNSAQQALDAVQKSAAQGDGAARADLRDGYLQTNLGEAKTKLQTAVGAEIQARARADGVPLNPDAIANYGADIAGRHASAPSEKTLIGNAVTELRTSKQVDDIVTPAAEQGDPRKALETLSAGYAKASPEVQQRILYDPRTTALLDKATAYANEPLQQRARDQMSLKAPASQAADRLETITRDLDPAIQQAVAQKALPGYEAFAQRTDADLGGQVPILGQSGVTSLAILGSRIYNVPGGSSTVAGYANLHSDELSNGVLNAVYKGAGPAFLIEYARSHPDVDVGFAMSNALEYVDVYRGTVKDHATDYAKHMEEIGWLVQNHGASMTPEQLDQAIADYTKAKGPDWEKQAEADRQQLADDGTHLLDQINQLQNLPPELASQQGAVNDGIQKILDDPASRLAISTALSQRPQLAEGDTGLRNLQTFASFTKLGDQGRKLAQEFATAYVKQTVLTKITDADVNNPQSLAQARSAIAELKDGRFATLLGVSEKDMNRAISAVEDAVPGVGDTPEQAAARIGKLNTTLDGITDADSGIKAFDKGTLPGQLLRGLGVAAAGVSLINSSAKAIDDPSLKNLLKPVVDAASLGQKGSELLLGLGKVDETSTIGQFGGKAAGKFLGVLSAAFDGWNAIDSFVKGDPTSGVLYGTGAAGGVMAALGAGSWAGPVGIGLVVISVAGLAVWNNIKQSNAHDNQTSADFLAHAGFTPSAAKALVDQSGDGNSPVPLLMKYGELKGLSQQQTVQWLNGLSGDQLATLRDRVHHTIDDYDNDLSKYTAGSPEIAAGIAQIRQESAPFNPDDHDYWIAQLMPQTVMETDAMMDGLHIPHP